MDCRSLVFATLLLLPTGACSGRSKIPAEDRPATLRIAVASNFAPTLARIATGFEKQTGSSVLLSSGSSGKHYAQIHNGAPFAIFFAADADLPLRLEQEGAIVRDSRATYAIGSLVLWSPDPGLVDAAGEVLGSDGFRYLAVANPDLAPYGKASRQTLESLGLQEQLEGKLVRGENIGQAYQFVHSGNAELGFAAWSQLARQADAHEFSYWRVPETLHDPLIQQVVLLKESSQARAFLTYLQGEEARTIIQDSGYRLP